MVRSTVLLTAALISFSAIACRDSLGLGGLKFEERPSVITKYPEGQGGEGGIILPPFHAELPMWIPDRFKVFPSTLGTSFARFYLYDEKTGELERYYGPEKNLYDETLSFPPNQTFLGESSSGSDAALFGYNGETGIVSIVQDFRDAEDPLVLDTSAGSPNYTTLLLYSFPNFSPRKLLVHNAESGAFRYVTAPSTCAESSEPLVGSLPLRDVSFSAWPDPTVPRVFAFDLAKNEGSLWTLGEPSELIATLAMSRPTTHAIIIAMNGGAGLLTYDRNSGQAETLSLSIEGAKLVTVSKEKALWPAGFTDLLFVPTENSLLGFNATTRILALCSYAPLRGDSVIVK